MRTEHCGVTEEVYRRRTVHPPRATDGSELADDRPVGEGGVLFIEVLPRARRGAPAEQTFGLHPLETEFPTTTTTEADAALLAGLIIELEF